MDDKQKILIVDDRPENLLSLEKILDDLDADLVRANSGNEALKATLHRDFALAILDVQMPGMDGYELAEYLRGDKHTRHLPIIFLTAFHQDDHQMFKGYEAGGVDFLTKPYQPPILLAKVRIFLQLDRQKKQLEEKLEVERSKTYLENILAAMSEAVIVVSRDGLIQKTNGAAQQLLGLTEAELSGEPIGRFIVQDEKAQTTLGGSEGDFAAQQIQPFENQAHILRNCRNTRIPIALSLSHFQNGSGQVVGAVLVASDIRERQKEEQTRIYLEKMRALGAMTAGMAHELNNPMMGILGFAEYCRSHTDVDDRRYEILADIERETRRCIDIVKNLLTFSHSGRGHTTQREMIGLDVIIERVLKLLSYRIIKEQVAIVRNGFDSAVKANINSETMQQVFLNLIANALDALMGQNDKQIQIGIRPENQDLLVEVVDNGTGIDAETGKAMFEPFYTTKPAGQGTGLGLATAMSIVEAHGGDIRCISEKNVGTTFVVRLPMDAVNDVTMEQVQ